MRSKYSLTWKGNPERYQMCKYIVDDFPLTDFNQAKLTAIKLTQKDFGSYKNV